MSGQDRRDIGVEDLMAVAEDDDPVRRLLNVRGDVRGQHGGAALFADAFHEEIQEFAPGEWVKVGERLVEQVRVCASRKDEREMYLRLLAAREEQRGAVHRNAQFVEPTMRELPVEGRP